MKADIKKIKNTMTIKLATEYAKLDQERLTLNRKANEIQKQLEAIKETLQEMIGTPDEVVDVPLVTEVDKVVITQVYKFRAAYEVKESTSLRFNVAVKL